MTDRAPRPEGMSEEAAKARKLFEALCEPHDERKEDGEHAWSACRTCLAREQLEYDSTVPLIKAMLDDWDRLRADVATLKVRADEAHAAHAASFGALSTLSAALLDGEVDDYAALAEKIIARVTQAEADGATLRERVKELTEDAEAWRALQKYNAGVNE